MTVLFFVSVFSGSTFFFFFFPTLFKVCRRGGDLSRPSNRGARETRGLEWLRKNFSGGKGGTFFFDAFGEGFVSGISEASLGEIRRA